MTWQMILCEVIRLICAPFLPRNFILILGLSVSEPVVFHVPAFGATFLHWRMNKTSCCGVISDHFSLSLRMSHAFECISNTNCNHTVVEGSPCIPLWQHITRHFARCDTQSILEHCIVEDMFYLTMERLKDKSGQLLYFMHLAGLSTPHPTLLGVACLWHSSVT